MHLPAKVNSLSMQTFMAIKTHSDSDSEGFLEKNRDAVSSDIIKLINTSTNKLLRMIYETELNTNGAKCSNNHKVVLTPKSSLRVRNVTTECHNVPCQLSKESIHK